MSVTMGVRPFVQENNVCRRYQEAAQAIASRGEVVCAASLAAELKIPEARVRVFISLNPTLLPVGKNVTQAQRVPPESQPEAGMVPVKRGVHAQRYKKPRLVSDAKRAAFAQASTQLWSQSTKDKPLRAIDLATRASSLLKNRYSLGSLKIQYYDLFSAKERECLQDPRLAGAGG